MVPEWYIDTSYGNPENGFAQELHKARETLEDQQDLALEAFPIRISDLIIGDRRDIFTHHFNETWIFQPTVALNATFVSRGAVKTPTYDGSMVRRNAGGQMREDTRANRTVTNHRTRINGDDRIDADMLHVKS